MKPDTILSAMEQSFNVNRFLYRGKGLVRCYRQYTAFRNRILLMCEKPHWTDGIREEDWIDSPQDE